ncbi:MAG: KamA family radical SAM protein [Alphaproteobacteria bacterium]|nr:KamA family radical SAM protein [Alphaproteobacteria bacterium]
MKEDALVVAKTEPSSTTTAVPVRQKSTPKPEPGSNVLPFFDPLGGAAKTSRYYHRFPLSPRTNAFRKRFYPDATLAEWNDWRWQARARFKSLADLDRVLKLSEEERAAIGRHTGALPLGITPYYTSLLDETDPTDALRKTVVPVEGEYLRSPGEADDPLGEDHDAKVPGLVHRYPDRVLFLTTGFCSTYCRYCTRSRMVGNAGGEYHFSVPQWEKALDYIEATPTIRDVLLSGGDPLTLADEKLDYLLGRLRRIKHVEFVRIGTKQPVVLPQRITPAFTRMLKKHHPLWMSLHFLHPGELTPEVTEACDRLADAGVPLGSQTVLLKGVNDSVATMKALMHGLLMRRVKPYYIFQCDPITGSAHFRTPIEKGLEIVEGLRGHTTGYAVPHYVIDLPGGGGKVTLAPDYVQGRDGDFLVLRNFEGGTYRYPDPDGRVGAALKAGAAPARV